MVGIGGGGGGGGGGVSLNPFLKYRMKPIM